ncbi:hypothetical protein BDV18DRAFT_141275 [Aspergillus unguis]
MIARYHRLLWITVPPAIGIYALDRKLSDLEARYPALPVDRSTCSAALCTPNAPATQHVAYVDIYAARVNCTGLVKRGEPLTPQIFNRVKAEFFRSGGEAWAVAVLTSRIMWTEGCIIGLLSGRGWNPGDIGRSVEGFGPVCADALPIKSAPGAGASTKDMERKKKKRELLHGALTVECPPMPDNPYGLLVSWKLPDGPRLFFEKIARWGYPWRLMSGGRHELSMSEPYYVPGRESEGMFFDLRFSSAHDYEIVPEEGGIEKQKTIPKWIARLHRGYARWILDRAARDFRSSLRRVANRQRRRA